MKNAIFMSSCVGALAALPLCQAAPFQNLNFDSANTNNVQYEPGFGGAGSTSELLPGWQLLFGTTPQTTTGFNLVLDGTSYNTIWSSISGAPVIGRYSFDMSTTPFAGGPYIPFSLSQSGDLPSNVKSIHFLSYGLPLELRVNGSLVPLNYTPAARQPGWTLPIPVFDAVGDISPFAGQTVDLKFTTLPSSTIFPDNGLDEIYFSTIGVPEPSTVLVFSLGGLALLIRRFRRK